MRRKIPVVTLLMFLSCQLYSQSYMHSIGANISAVFGKINTPYESGSFAMEVNHFSYFPRFTFSEAENSSFSIGSPLGAGVNLLTNSFGDGGISWGFDLPLVVDYNTGCKSTPENEDSFGGYFGAGFGYLYTSYKLSSDDSKTVRNYGPLVRAGIRFASGEGRWHTTVGFFYKIGLETERFKAAGVNVYMDL